MNIRFYWNFFQMLKFKSIIDVPIYLYTDPYKLDTGNLKKK